MKLCARKWQVEAARDGRLRGKDLLSAERHRETCAECTQEASELEALSNAVAHLSTLARDPITVHRTRQQLLSRFNESVLEPTVKRVPTRAALALGCAAALLASLWLTAHRAPHAVSSAHATSFVQVEGAPEAHWTEQLGTDLDRIALSGGSATFKVRPHPGRRVIISLPDGEIEDLGTVFKVLVRDGATKRVAVSEGRVLLRLHGHPETTVSAGESWDAQAPLPKPVVAAPRAALPSATRTTSSAVPASAATVSNTRPAAVRARAGATAVPSAVEPPPVTPNKSDTESAAAEDDAYLQVVGLLRAGKQDEARAGAKRYLLRFPNGFRRVEVLNIVTR